MNPPESIVPVDATEGQASDFEHQLEKLKVATETVTAKVEGIIKSLYDEIGRVLPHLANIKVASSHINKEVFEIGMNSLFQEHPVREENILVTLMTRLQSVDVVKEGAEARHIYDKNPAINEKTEVIPSKEKKQICHNLVDCGVSDEHSEEQEVEKPTDKDAAANELDEGPSQE